MLQNDLYSKLIYIAQNSNIPVGIIKLESAVAHELAQNANSKSRAEFGIIQEQRAITAS